MPAFDPARGCHVLRVVFDGAALAGKTTNLQRLCELVPAERRSEMYTPGALKGRTMFFDWLEIDGPASADPPLKFQLITVPGQVQRNYRRRPLIEMADVVVFVFDSSPSGVEPSVATWNRLRPLLQKKPRALIVQANKQDQPDALDPEAVRAALRLKPSVAVLGTSSMSGLGVQSTLVMALKHARAVLQRELQSGALAEVSSAEADADALFFAMLDREEQDQEGELEALSAE